MKNLISKTVEAFLIIGIVFVLGLLVPMLVTTLVVVFTKETFNNIIGTSVIFWLFTIIGWIISAIFVDNKISEL